MKFSLPGITEDESVQMAPMIDMVFLLLIFFMVASHLNKMDRVEIEPPIAENSAVPDELAGRRTITIKADDTIFVGSTSRELEEVAPLVESAKRHEPHLKIYLRADRNVKHKRVRDVMKACADAGVLEIIFATYESDRS